MAGLDDPCATHLVKTTLSILAQAKGARRERTTDISGSTFDAAELDVMRAAAVSRKRQGVGLESPDNARSRSQVDLALCSMVLEAGLHSRVAAALEWQDLQVDENGRPVIRVRSRSSDAIEVIGISGRAFADLEAIARDSREENQRIFPMTAQCISTRIRAVAQTAGLEGKITSASSSRGSSVPYPGVSSGANTGPLEKVNRNHDSRWRAFCAWCNERNLVNLPASAVTVAAYLRELSESKSAVSVRAYLGAIAYAHRVAGYNNPSATGLVKTTMREIRGFRFACDRLNSASLAAIRAYAMVPRRRGTGLESPENCTRRGRVDIALCSILHAAAMTPSQASVLQWRDVEKFGEDGMRLTIRNEAAPRRGEQVRVISGEAVRDLESIRGDARQEDKVFGLTANAIYDRIREAMRVAGLA
ncbi:MAG: hypothetical protein OXP09_06980 [Gammaproteobacteria bacterium]|nr:hypothetical protein [Gammaproteobacteria bacterium]MDE0365303.1 hypothetical protein [Gammaproteobacteria bacterium]